MLFGGGGNDVFEDLSGNDSIRGGSGNDIINAGAGTDSVYGEGGDDVFLGNADSVVDIIDGGLGNDTCALSQHDHGITQDILTSIESTPP